MLTMDEVKNISFRKANIGGYRPEDVDVFIDNVIDSYKQLLDKNAEIENKLGLLTKEIDKYKEDENCLKSALISAQKLSEASIREAKHKADAIIKDANLKAEKIVSNAESRITDEKSKFEIVKKEVLDFKNNLKEIYKSHLKLIDSIPERKIKEESNTEKATITKKDENISSDSKETSKKPEEIKSHSAEKKESKKDGKKVKLKFGEDYDIKEDEDESPIGLFD